MLLGRFYFVAFALPIRLQSYRCFHTYCHSLATFMFISFIKRSAILRVFIVLGGGGGYVELSLRFNVPPTWTV